MSSMKKETVIQLHSDFERSIQMVEDDGAEYWLARDLQALLGYSQWRSFATVIDKAVTSCINAGYEPGDHFAHARKMVERRFASEVKKLASRTKAFTLPKPEEKAENNK